MLQIQEKVHLINSAATEPQTGRPNTWRENQQTTTKKKEEIKWVINGHKSFTTMSPVFWITLSLVQGFSQEVMMLVKFVNFENQNAGVTI